MAIKQNAVDGFLASLGSLTKDEALANLVLDTRLYRWSAETVKAIQDGIESRFQADDAMITNIQVLKREVFMYCLKCQAETSGDYPACATCAPFMHFSHRTDCKCQAPECEAKRLSAHATTEADHSKAVIQCGLVVAPAQDEIVITPSARGYRFTLPEWCAPSPNAVSGLKMPGLKIGYNKDNRVRRFPSETLAAVLDFLNYWYVEPNPLMLTQNRNGGKLCTVRVEDAK